MNELNKLIFWLGVATAVWLYMSNIGIADLINAPIIGISNGLDSTVEAWIDIKRNNKLNPRR